MLILNSGCEILTQRGQWNGIAVKSTSGRICKRALPRKTPAPKDRRSDVNTTCKYKLERVSWSKKTIKYLFSKSLIISFYCNLNSGLQSSKTKGPLNTQDPESWTLEDWWMPCGCDQSDTTEMDESFFGGVSEIPCCLSTKAANVMQPLPVFAYYFWGHQMIMDDELWWSWCSCLIFVTYE